MNYHENLPSWNRAMLLTVAAGKVEYLGFPPWEVSTAAGNTSVVGDDIALVFIFVDHVGISDDKEHPETVHAYTGHQTKPAHDSDLSNGRIVIGKALYHNVYSFVEKDPNTVDYQAPVHVGVH